MGLTIVYGNLIKMIKIPCLEWGMVSSSQTNPKNGMGQDNHMIITRYYQGLLGMRIFLCKLVRGALARGFWSIVLGARSRAHGYPGHRPKDASEVLAMVLKTIKLFPVGTPGLVYCITRLGAWARSIPPWGLSNPPRYFTDGAGERSNYSILQPSKGT